MKKVIIKEYIGIIKPGYSYYRSSYCSFLHDNNIIPLILSTVFLSMHGVYPNSIIGKTWEEYISTHRYDVLGIMREYAYIHLN